MKWTAIQHRSSYQYHYASQRETDTESAPAFAPILTTGFEFIENLPPREIVAAGTELIEQGSAVQSVYLVCRGLVKLVYLSEGGEESGLGLRSVGWWGGASAAMLNAASTCSVISVVDCEVIRVPAQEFRNGLRSNAVMLQHFVKALCNENASQMEAQAQVMSGTAEERLSFFMRERERQTPHWQTLDPLPMLKQMELAQLLSITPEHLSRLTSKKRAAHGVGYRK